MCEHRRRTGAGLAPAICLRLEQSRQRTFAPTVAFSLPRGEGYNRRSQNAARCRPQATGGEGVLFLLVQEKVPKEAR